MSSSSAALLHLGFPKAGSTFLQEGLFARHPELQAIGKPLNLTDPRVSDILWEVRFCDSVLVKSRMKALRSVVNQLCDTERIPVFSAEEFSVGPYWPTRIHKTADRVSVAKSLVELFPGASILLVVREPLSWLQSSYAQLLAGGNRLPSFQGWIDQQLATLYRGSMLDALDIEPLVNLYDSLFGSERVLVVGFDRLEQSPEQFQRTITDFLGIASVGQETAPSHANLRKSSAHTRVRRAIRSSQLIRGFARRAPESLRTFARTVASNLGGNVDVTYSDEQRDAIVKVSRPSAIWLQNRLTTHAATTTGQATSAHGQWPAF